MVYLGLNAEQRREIKAALPLHALKAATACHKLGILTRVRVRYKDGNGKQFESDKFCDMRNLIRHYQSYGKKDLLSYAEQAHFNGYKRYRAMHATTQDRATSKEIADYKKLASVTKPLTNTRKGTTQKWAYALEYPDVRQFKANEVHREAPLSQMRRVIYDIEQAAEIMRKDPENRKIGWDMDVTAKDKDGKLVHAEVDVVRQRQMYTLPAELDAWLVKARRHCDLYYEMLAEWVEENGRELNLRAVMWNLYYNKFQVPVNEYVHLVRDDKIAEAIMQFNYCHTKYLRNKARAGWAKLRYWTFCHFPNRLSKIVRWWQEETIMNLCKPPNGRLFREQFQEWTGEEEISDEDQALLEKGALGALPSVVEPEFEEIFPPPPQAEEAEAKAGKSKKRAAPTGPREESGSESEDDGQGTPNINPRRVIKARHDSSDESGSESG